MQKSELNLPKRDLSPVGTEFVGGDWRENAERERGLSINQRNSVVLERIPRFAIEHCRRNAGSYGCRRQFYATVDGQRAASAGTPKQC